MFQMSDQITGILLTALLNFSNGNSWLWNICFFFNFSFLLIIFFLVKKNICTTVILLNKCIVIFFSNWKLILLFGVVILLFSVTFFTKKDITFAVNIWVFPSKYVKLFIYGWESAKLRIIRNEIALVNDIFSVL